MQPNVSAEYSLKCLACKYNKYNGNIAESLMAQGPMTVQGTSVKRVGVEFHTKLGTLLAYI